MAATDVLIHPPMVEIHFCPSSQFFSHPPPPYLRRLPVVVAGKASLPPASIVDFVTGIVYNGFTGLRS